MTRWRISNMPRLFGLGTLEITGLQADAALHRWSLQSNFAGADRSAAEPWVNAVADVRSIPFSRRLPQFNRPELEGSAAKQGVKYVFLGEELGARRDEPEAYDGLQAAYERVAELPAFKRGLERVMTGVSKGLSLALLCAERDPLTCHRAVLVCRHLVNRGLDVQHIHGDGRLESQGELELRMQKALQRLGVLEVFNGTVQLDLLGNPISSPPASNADDQLERAYWEQGKRIAYCKPLIAA